MPNRSEAVTFTENLPENYVTQTIVNVSSQQTYSPDDDNFWYLPGVRVLQKKLKQALKPINARPEHR